MAVEKFTIQSLATIDGGRVAVALEQAIKRARLDCEDRPAVEKERTVALAITLTPISRPDGSLDSCRVRFDIKETLPKRSSPEYSMKADTGGLFYNELSRDDVKQGTLDQAGADLGPQGKVGGGAS